MPFLCKYVQCSYNVLRKYVLSNCVVANNVSSLSNSRLLLQVSGTGFLSFFLRQIIFFLILLVGEKLPPVVGGNKYRDCRDERPGNTQS